MRRLLSALLLITSGLSLSSPALAQKNPFCGDEGIWIQILGAGGPELNDGQAGSSYLIWIDNKARLLIDTGPGAAANFDRAGADFADLDAIVYTHLHADHSGDFPAFVKGSFFAERDRPLPVLGPNGNEEYPDMTSFVSRMIGPAGAYPYLADFLTYKSSGGYKINPRKVPATGRRRWSRFNSEHFRLSSIPVHHGPVPAIAWRVEIGDQNIVFTGDFNNSKNVIAEFAENAEALVVSHAIPEGARGNAAELHATPGQLGRIAAQAEVRMLILGHRMNRTRGLESQSRLAIETAYNGPLIFANDMECWGL
jgi:ribonuclease BN (tRNA processing enzyme)